MEIDKDDERLYLQFLQNNIARMNTNSAQAKGWCIAIIAALLAIFADTKNSLFLLICIVPIVLFCILDTLYLQQEHKFVGMYNDFVKDKENKPKVYEMPMKSYAKGMKGFLKALRSWSVGLVYGLLLMTIIVSFCIFSYKNEGTKKTETVIQTETINDTNTPVITEPVFKSLE